METLPASPPEKDLPPQPPAATTTEEVVKVNLFLRPVGEAPALKKAKYRLDGRKCLIDVERFLKKTIGTNQSLFLYCGSGFAPTPDQNLQDLFDCFQVGGELVITYGIQEAWG